MNTAYREGVITSFIPEQGFGIIQGDDTNVYRFMPSDIEGGVKLTPKMRVSFEASETSTGHAASKVQLIAEPLEMRADLDQFKVSDNDFLGGRNEVVYEFDHPCFASAPQQDQARQALINKARSLGANAIIRVRSIAIRGRKESVFHMEGTMVFAQQRVVTYDPVELEASKERVRKATDAAIALDEGYRKFIMANPLKVLFGRIVDPMVKRLADSARSQKPW